MRKKIFITLTLALLIIVPFAEPKSESKNYTVQKFLGQGEKK